MRAYFSSLLLFCVGVAFANGFYGNNSDIKWKAASTAHFNFIYPAEYTAHASKVSTYAEAVYDSVVSRYHSTTRSTATVTPFRAKIPLTCGSPTGSSKSAAATAGFRMW